MTPLERSLPMTQTLLSAIFDRDFSKIERAVLVLVATYLNDEGVAACPPIDTLAQRSGYSPRAVQYALRSLESRGVLVVQGGAKGGRGTTRTYLINPLAAPVAPGASDEGAERVQTATDQVEKGAMIAPFSSERVQTTTLKGANHDIKGATVAPFSPSAAAPHDERGEDININIQDSPSPTLSTKSEVILVPLTESYTTTPTPLPPSPTVPAAAAATTARSNGISPLGGSIFPLLRVAACELTGRDRLTKAQERVLTGMVDASLGRIDDRMIAYARDQTAKHVSGDGALAYFQRVMSTCLENPTDYDNPERRQNGNGTWRASGATVPQRPTPEEAERRMAEQRETKHAALERAFAKQFGKSGPHE